MLGGRRQSGDPAQQLPAVAQRDAELLQVALAKVRQNIEIDVVLDKCPSVLRKPEILQPALDIRHHRAATGSNRSGL